MQIILASQNKNKLKELSTIFQINLSKHSLVSPRKFLNVIEDKETIKENAKKKALELVEEACEAISVFEDRSKNLCQIANFIVSRQF